MSIHYNGFISYRHCPVDSKVAEEVQHQLERFTIPKALQKKTGIKKIERIFRDKEELPITMDINENIGDAIRNSDFLILICSPHTQESQWVMREIDLFLQTHTKDHILTVLSEGDPAETIPRLLRYEEEEDSETGEMFRKEIEPLSSDFRLPFKKARQVELPRLLAAMLGVSYDEIVQRTHQYQVRRRNTILSVIAAALSIFTGYVIYSNLQIREANEKLADTNLQLEDTNNQLADTNLQLEDANRQLADSYEEVQENYEQSLRNQSEYLAAEALNALEDGNTLLAIQLAQAALIDGDENRPELSKAIFALEKAVNAYGKSGDEAVSGVYAIDSEIVDYRKSADNSRLYVLDRSGFVTAWDTENYAQLYRFFGGKNGVLPNSWEFAGEGYLVLWGGSFFDGFVSCFDLETGEECWMISESDGCKEEYYKEHPDSYASYTAEYFNNAVVMDAETVLIYSYDRFALVSVEDGSLLRKGEECDGLIQTVQRADEDHAWVLLKKTTITNTAMLYDYTTYSYLLIQMSDLSVLETPEYMKVCTSSVQDGKLLVLGIPEEEVISEWRWRYSDEEAEQEMRSLSRVLEAYNPSDTENPLVPVWKLTAGDIQSAELLPEGAETFRLYYDNRFARISLSDGTVLEKGYLVEASEESEEVTDISDLLMNGTSALASYSQTADESWQAFSMEPVWTKTYYLSGNRLIYWEYTLDGKQLFHCVNILSGREEWCTDIQSEEGLSNGIQYAAGLSEDGSELYLYAYHKGVAVLNLENGSLRIIELPKCDTFICIEKDAAYYLISGSESQPEYLRRVYLGEEDPENWPGEGISMDQSYYNELLDRTEGFLSAGCKDGFTYVDKEGKLRLVNVSSGEEICTDIEVSISGLHIWTEEGDRCVTASVYETYLLDQSGNILTTYPVASSQIISGTFGPDDMVYFLTKDGNIHEYTVDGTYKGSIDVRAKFTGFMDIGTSENITWSFNEDRYLMVTSENHGILKVDLREQEVREHAAAAVFYSEENSCYILMQYQGKIEDPSGTSGDGYDSYVFGSVPVYTKETLLEKVSGILRDTEIDEASRRTYGLSSN